MNIIIENLNKKYEDKVIFKDFDIEFEKNKINIILGKSGCGKTTLLKIITDIIPYESGNIKGIDSDKLSFVFQEDRLIDWITVEENIKLILRKDYTKTQADKICSKYLELVDVVDYKDYYPQKLSGGMRQRVNIARAFAKQSEIIIMDEPFKSIDIKNKNDIMKLLKEIIQNENRTVLLVTHDIEEALYFDGNIFILGDTPLILRKEVKTCDVLNKEEIIKLI